MGEQKEQPGYDLVQTFEHLRTEEPEFYERLRSERLTVCVFPGDRYLGSISDYAIWNGDDSIMHGRTKLEVEDLERDIESAIRTLRDRGFSLTFLPWRERRRHSARRV